MRQPSPVFRCFGGRSVQADRFDSQAVFLISLGNSQKGAVFGHPEQLGVHGVAQRGVALEEADAVLFGKEFGLQDPEFARRHFFLGDADIHRDGVNAARNASDYRKETVAIRDGSISVHLAPGGACVLEI